MRAPHHPPDAPEALHARLTRFLRGLANGKTFNPTYRRGEARELLQAIEEGQDSPAYVQPREGWEPRTAFEGYDRTRGNVEPEEGALKTPQPEA